MVVRLSIRFAARLAYFPSPKWPAPRQVPRFGRRSMRAVLFWPGEAERLGDVTTAAEAWLAEYLSNEEDRRGARVVDGYLLVALPCAVEEEHASLVRGIELSTQVCRKHVIWPDDSGRWRRLDGVTVLGLPAGVTSASGEPTWPSLTGEAATLWSSIQKLGPLRAAQAKKRGNLDRAADHRESEDRGVPWCDCAFGA